MPTKHLDFAAGVRADVLLRQNRPQDALGALDRAPRKANAWAEFVVAGEREVFLRARALHLLGRNEEALQWYTTRSLVLLGPSHYYRGQIYQELGDTEKALWHYSAFTEMWQDADPEYQPLVEDVRERMARLTGEE